jgi:predicted DNA-binding transcriptional regulator AlpA
MTLMKTDPPQRQRASRPVPADASLISATEEQRPNLNSGAGIANSESAIMLIDEVADTLKISRKQIERLERRGAFPIPRLPKLDRHPRYSREAVERFIAGKPLPLSTRRRKRAA